VQDEADASLSNVPTASWKKRQLPEARRVFQHVSLGSRSAFFFESITTQSLTFSKTGITIEVNYDSLMDNEFRNMQTSLWTEITEMPIIDESGRTLSS
jgi:hypothetical protein